MHSRRVQASLHHSSGLRKPQISEVYQQRDSSYYKTGHPLLLVLPLHTDPEPVLSDPEPVLSNPHPQKFIYNPSEYFHTISISFVHLGTLDEFPHQYFAQNPRLRLPRHVTTTKQSPMVHRSGNIRGTNAR